MNYYVYNLPRFPINDFLS